MGLFHNSGTRARLTTKISSRAEIGDISTMEVSVTKELIDLVKRIEQKGCVFGDGGEALQLTAIQLLGCHFAIGVMKAANGLRGGACHKDFPELCWGSGRSLCSALVHTLVAFTANVAGGNVPPETLQRICETTIAGQIEEAVAAVSAADKTNRMG